MKPAQAARTFVAIDDEGTVYYGAQAVFVVVANTGGILGFIAKLGKNQFSSRLIEPLYQLFAKHRGRIAFLFDHPD